MGDQYNLKFGPGSAEAVDAYLEYHRIVGDDDNGKLFTPEEYADYKKNVLPARLKNRLFVSWTSPNGMDCKLIGPETPCFCQHRYKQHKTDFQVLPTKRPIHLPCKVKSCHCSTYEFVPLNGSQSVRCQCKHTSEDHEEAEGHLCKKCKGKCGSFRSPFTCTCGQPAYLHQTIVETKEERLARGHPVGQDVPYAAMGGLTGFSSLAEAYLRLDDSGIGAPDESFLSQPVTTSDHPFLRMHTRDGGFSDEDVLSHGMQAVQLTGSNRDMDYYEQRYQARLREERQRARGSAPSKKKAISKGSTMKQGPPAR
ncbi:hypothetical protein HOLleu_34656 [Holothuria leucospilota]|uniref:Protein FAM221A n=1 Tax=Holothuria leucospilota TaxID=206669 RepID=A0A9Q0YLD5_HOLLE|nr:hypothetical protein HOLleu_34656 [Holothuria leucospilota]